MLAMLFTSTVASPTTCAPTESAIALNFIAPFYTFVKGKKSKGLESWQGSLRSYMEKKIFWIVFTLLGLLADFTLPLWWALGATIPILYVSWWVAYKSDWF